ncbi:MAG: ATP-binding cassette domain-containing protein, partial [Mesorhizobium sp.]
RQIGTREIVWRAAADRGDELHILASRQCRRQFVRLELGRWIDRPIAEYSLGTRAKVAILAALLGRPPLLILDETLNGLDPVAAWEVKRVITALCASGRHAVIVSTHVVEAVPALCSRAVLMADGSLSRSWDTAQLAEAGRAPGGFEDSVMQALRLLAA